MAGPLNSEYAPLTYGLCLLGVIYSTLLPKMAEDFPSPKNPNCHYWQVSISVCIYSYIYGALWKAQGGDLPHLAGSTLLDGWQCPNFSLLEVGTTFALEEPIN
jgi:hypothetical protein